MTPFNNADISYAFLVGNDIKFRLLLNGLTSPEQAEHARNGRNAIHHARDTADRALARAGFGLTQKVFEIHGQMGNHRTPYAFSYDNPWGTFAEIPLNAKAADVIDNTETQIASTRLVNTRASEIVYKDADLYIQHYHCWDVMSPNGDKPLRYVTVESCAGDQYAQMIHNLDSAPDAYTVAKGIYVQKNIAALEDFIACQTDAGLLLPLHCPPAQMEQTHARHLT